MADIGIVKYVSLKNPDLIYDTMEEVKTARAANPTDDDYKFFERKIIITLDSDVTNTDVQTKHLETIRGKSKDCCFEVWGDKDPNQGGGIKFMGRSATGDNCLEFYQGSTLKISLHDNGYILFHNLPTSDPGIAGALWNDADYLAVSTG